ADGHEAEDVELTRRQSLRERGFAEVGPGAGRRLGGGEHSLARRDPLERLLAALEKLETRALRELARCPACEHLAWSGPVRDPRCDVERDAPHLPVDELELSRVDASPDRQAEPLRADDERKCAAHGSRRAVE